MTSSGVEENSTSFVLRQMLAMADRPSASLICSSTSMDTMRSHEQSRGSNADATRQYGRMSGRTSLMAYSEMSMPNASTPLSRSDSTRKPFAQPTSSTRLGLISDTM